MTDAETPEAHVTSIDFGSSEPLVAKVREAFQTALLNQRTIDEAIYAVPSFCGRKYRLFINTLMNSLDDARYLEIGIFKGGTFCAAISGNKVRAVGIDNWSWAKEENMPAIFYGHLANHAVKGSSISVFDQDFKTIEFNKIGKFNVYFYDGDHKEQDQYDGVCFAQPAIDDVSVLIVDDWNHAVVRSGTYRAIKDLNINVELAIELRTSFDDSIPKLAGGHSDWHNGTFVGVVRKPASPPK